MSLTPAISVRQQIIDFVAAELKALRYVGESVYTNADHPFPFAPEELPAIRIFDRGDDSVVNETIHWPSKQTRVGQFVIQLIFKSDSELAQKVSEVEVSIEKALQADIDKVTAGRLANGGLRKSASQIDVSNETDVASMELRIQYDAVYFCMSNSPDVAI